MQFDGVWTLDFFYPQKWQIGSEICLPNFKISRIWQNFEVFGHSCSECFPKQLLVSSYGSGLWLVGSGNCIATTNLWAIRYEASDKYMYCHKSGTSSLSCGDTEDRTQCMLNICLVTIFLIRPQTWYNEYSLLARPHNIHRVIVWNRNVFVFWYLQN